MRIRVCFNFLRLTQITESIPSFSQLSIICPNYSPPLLSFAVISLFDNKYSSHSEINNNKLLLISIIHEALHISG